MKKIGLIGAGTMGQGIMLAFAKAGFEVVVADVKKEFADNGVAKAGKKLDKAVEKGKMDTDTCAKAKALTKSGEYADMKDCDLIVEAALESMDIKKQIFSELDKICKDGCILASNTSSLSITEIGKGINHDVIGMHFFNPADVMKLIEVINGIHTKPETTKAVKELSVAIGKTPVEVAEAPGFVVNRILIPLINEAAFILQEGVASAEDIDNAMKLGANHPMGPLALGDLVGLDIVEAIMDTLYREMRDSKYRCCPLIRKMVRGGLLGMKTKKGFFNYDK